jgi:hypothetical protein
MKSLRLSAIVVLGITTAALTVSSAWADEGGALTPCLSAAADYSAGWPTTVFPAGGKRMVAVFQLGEGEKFEKLSSRWVVVDVGDAAPAGKELGKTDLELKGSRRGRFQYTQDVPLPVGKYRLDVQADGKPWRSADLTVAPDVAPIELKSAAELLSLKEGQTWEYESIAWAGNGASSGPDAKVRQRFTVTIGPKEEAGWRVDITASGKTMGQAWWQLTDEGLVLTQMKDGDKVAKVEPPRLLVPLPKQLPMFWSWQAKDGSDKHDCQAWGPFTVSPPLAKPVRGYLITTDTSTEEGRKTMSQIFVPGYGLLSEYDVTADKDGQAIQRTLIMVAGPPRYKITPNSASKGRMGRLIVRFPKGGKMTNTEVEVFADAARKERSDHGYGEKTFELLPGSYWVTVSGAVVPLEVQSRSDTVVLTGALRVEASANTAVGVFADPECTKQLIHFYGVRDVGLPLGTYYVRISGKSEPVKIEEGKITEF